MMEFEKDWIIIPTSNYWGSHKSQVPVTTKQFLIQFIAISIGKLLKHDEFQHGI